MKSLILVLVLGCVAAAMADCNALQRLKVKSQWSKAFGQGQDRIEFGTSLWRAVFAQEPSYREMFKNVGGDEVTSPEFEAHSQRVLGGLDMAISLSDMPDVAKAALAHLHDQHVPRNVPDHAFDVMKNALMAAVNARLGKCLDKEAWSACYDGIAHGIMGH